MKLADTFTADQFDADAICDLAVLTGMRYIVFTTMHHDGFRLYDSDLCSYNSVNACGRDLTAEIIQSAKNKGLKIGLYHSLNNWFDQPDAVNALEDKDNYDVFIKNTFERIRELVTKYNPIDILWYDGWWPFNAEKWQAVAMNDMVRSIQPHILFNGRNGLPGDFGTPEGHITAPTPWRPWEACMTLNDHWGYYQGDNNWKPATEVINMLCKVANGHGNLLLNIGPKGDGSIPIESVKILEQTGQWLDKNGSCIFDTDIFTYDLQEKGDHRADFCSHGVYTASGNNLFLVLKYYEQSEVTICGLEVQVKNVEFLSTGSSVQFTQEGGKLTVSGLPENPPDKFLPVLKIECNAPPSLYQCAGMRIPKVPHPHYDPCESDIQE